MRILLSNQQRYRLSIVVYGHRNSLLPTWIYWPQKAFLFSAVFVKNVIADFIKNHFLQGVLVIVVFFVGHETVGSIVEKEFASIFSMVMFWVSIGLFVCATVLKSNRSTNRIIHPAGKRTYSREVEDDNLR